jgi:hypothetical protein
MSEEDEAEFDRQLLTNFAPIAPALLDRCKQADTEATGYIA